MKGIITATVICCLALTIFLSMSKASGVLSGDSFVTEITNLPFSAYVVDVDSEGRIFVQGENDVWRSEDVGASWTKVLDGVTTTSKSFVLFVDSRDYVYAQICMRGSIYSLYRSTDNGDSWTNIIDSTFVSSWHMVEDSKGYLYINTYSGKMYIYRSIDSGASFPVWYNATGEADHFHAVGIDSANDDVYVSAGDANDFIRRWNGVSWSNVTTEAEAGNGAQPTDIISDGSYIYFMPDAYTHIHRIPSGGSWSQRETVFCIQFAPQTTTNWAFEAVNLGDMMLFGTEEGQLWGTWDSERWVKIFYAGSTSTSIFSISNRKPIYFTERVAGKLYRLDATKQDLIHLWYKQHYTSKGSLTNANSYILEQRIWNGTNYIDLSNVALSNVQASIKGLTRYNWFPNGGFETGDVTGWEEVGTPKGVIRSDNPANGTYYYARNHSASCYICKTLSYYNGRADSQAGDLFLLSLYVKSNVSYTGAIGFILRDETTIRYHKTADVTASWNRLTFFHVLPATSTVGRWEIRFKPYALETSIDSLEFAVLEAGIHLGRINDDSIVYTERFSTGDFSEENQTTLNPTLTLAGQQVSHSGTLTNGTESSATSLSGILCGAVEVSANIQESGQAILKMNGTRVVYEDSIILEGRTGSVCYGRYYGTFSPTTSGNHLVLVTNLSATLSSISDYANKLQFVLTSPNATTTISRLYCANRGEPRAIYTVNATLTWSYNASTKILTLNATHENPTKILIYWKCPADRNNDGVVDVFDLAEICRAYGSTPTCSNWNENCDIDGDETISIYDLEICVENYGKDE